MFNDDYRRFIKAADRPPGGVDIQDIVVRKLPCPPIGRRPEAMAFATPRIIGGRLMRILAISQFMTALHADRDSASGTSPSIGCNNIGFARDRRELPRRNHGSAQRP